MRIPRLASWVTGGVAALATLAVLAPTARAQQEEAPVTVAVLGMEGVDTPEPLAGDITDALRQRVAGTRAFKLIPGKDLVELKLVFSCPDEAPSCMAEAGKSLGAAKLLYGNVKKSVSGDFVVSLRLLDVERGAVDTWVAETLPQKLATSAGIRSPVQQWFGTLMGQDLSGVVRVKANVPGATVSIDGQPVATTTDQDVSITGVPPGRHTVRVERPGYRTFEAESDVVPGSTQTVKVDLVPGGDAAMASEPTLGDADSRGVYRTAFWLTLLGTAASAGVATKFGMDVLDVNRDLDPYRRFPCTSPTGLCDNTDKPADPLNQAEQKLVNDRRDDGNRAEALQWIFVGVSGAFAATSGYLFYKGYLDEGRGGGGERRTASRKGLRVFPVAGASTGGLLAEFDF